MTESAAPIVYQLRVVLRGISPLIWRCLLVRSDSTIADLHCALQIAFGWTDRPVMRAVRHNQVMGTVVTSRRRAHERTLTVALAANGREVEVAAPGYAYAELALLPGEPVQLSLRKEALVVLQSGRPDQPADGTAPLPAGRADHG